MTVRVSVSSTSILGPRASGISTWDRADQEPEDEPEAQVMVEA